MEISVGCSGCAPAASTVRPAGSIGIVALSSVAVAGVVCCWCTEVSPYGAVMRRMFWAGVVIGGGGLIGPGVSSTAGSCRVRVPIGVEGVCCSTLLDVVGDCGAVISVALSRMKFG